MPDPADTTVVSLLRDELLLINNALNEVCNGVDFDDAEFATRLGASREEALQLLEKVKILLRRKVG